MRKAFKIRKKFFKKWVKALKSGDFVQGTSTLTFEENCGTRKYCCLGVAGTVIGLSAEELESFDTLVELEHIDEVDDLDMCLKEDLGEMLALLNDGYRKIQVDTWVRSHPNLLLLPRSYALEGEEVGSYSFEDIVFFLKANVNRY